MRHDAELWGWTGTGTEGQLGCILALSVSKPGNSHTRDILGSSKMSVCGDTNNCCWTFIIYTNSINVCGSNVFVGPCRPPRILLARSRLGPFLKLPPWAGTGWCSAHSLGLSYTHWSLMATDLNKAKEIARNIQFETQSKAFIWNHNTFYGLCHYPVKKKIK